MTRALTLAALLTAAMLAAHPAAAQSGAPALRADVVVTSELVRVGDLVDNAGPAAERPIFRAPDLGTTGNVPLDRILEALRSAGVRNIETRGVDQVSVTRASRAVRARDVEAAIRGAVAERLGAADASTLAVAFDKEPRTLHLDPTMNADLAISRLSYDRRDGRFDATLEIAGAAGRRATIHAAGRAQETAPVVLLTRPLKSGDVIRSGDVVIERRPRNEAANVVASLEDAVGMAAKRGLAAGMPLRNGDIAKPDIVQRNETVTIVFEAPGIMLTMRGKALDSGGEGDAVNVVNIQSKRTLQGVVTGPGRVSVSSMGSLALPAAETRRADLRAGRVEE